MAFGISAGGAMLIGAGAGLAGAYMQGQSAEDAANAQVAGADRASQLQRQTAQEQIALQRDQFNAQQNMIREQMARDQRIYDTAREDSRLGREVGQGALRQYWTDAVDRGFQYDPHAFDTDRIMNDPGVKFRQQTQENALRRQLNGSPTGIYSGAAAKALLEHSGNLASQEYGAAYGRAADAEARRKDQYQLRTNQLATLAGIGQTANSASQVAGQAYGSAGQNATAQSGQAGANYVNGAGNALGNMATGVGNNIIGAANAQAGNSMYQGNTWANAINGAGSAVGNYFRQSGGGGGGGNGYQGWGNQFGLGGNSGVDGW